MVKLARAIKAPGGAAPRATSENGKGRAARVEVGKGDITDCLRAIKGNQGQGQSEGNQGQTLIINFKEESTVGRGWAVVH
jgi:hypothetical protein